MGMMDGGERDGTRAPRRLPIALALNLAMPGLGHLYCGALREALAVWAVTLGTAVGLILLWAGWLFVPVLPAAVLGLAWVALQLVLARDLARRVRLDGARYRLRSFNHPLTYLAFWLGLGVLPLYFVTQVVGSAYVGTLVVTDETMFPKLLPGDHVLFDRSAFRDGRAPGAGELVVVYWPPAGPLVTRVIATGGQTVHLRDGRPVVDGRPVGRTRVEGLRVERFGHGPEARKLAAMEGYQERVGGHRYVVTYDPLDGPVDEPPPVTLGPAEIYVLGDNRNRSLVRRRFGKIPIDAVVGRPRYIWASVDPEGDLRDGRIGRNVR